MNLSLKCGSIAITCLALAFVVGGCPAVQNTPTKTTYAAAPVFSPPGGTYTDSVTVEITCTTEGATIYYTTDGTAPSQTHGKAYTGPISVDNQTDTQTTIRAIAYADGMNASLSIQSTYSFGGNKPPTINNPSVTGNLKPGQSGIVTVSCKASDSDGYVASVVADLSALGATSAQPLTLQSDGTWLWQGKVQPPTYGQIIVSLIATDDQGATSTPPATAKIDLKLDPGQMMWSYKTGGVVRSAPAIYDDGKNRTIYIGSEDSYLYVLDSDGSLKWKFSAMAAVTTTPAIASNGTIYVSGASTLYAVSTAGSQAWNYVAGGTIFSSPAIGTHGTIFFGAKDGKLYAVDASGDLEWTFATGGAISSSPAIGVDGVIYFGSADGNVYAVYANGTVKWSYSTGGAVSSSPALGADGTVYVGSSDGRLYAFNSDGSLKWRSYQGTNIAASPVISTDGVVYVGGNNGNLYAINMADGTLNWNYITSKAISAAAALADDGTIYFGSGDQNLYAVTKDGGLVWSFAASLGVNGSPAIDQDGVIYVGADDGQLYAIQGKAPDAQSAWPMARANLHRTGAAAGLPNNLTPLLSGLTVTCNLTKPLVGSPATITVDCQAIDYDGIVETVVADLSALGGSNAQTLTPASPGSYHWSGSLTPKVFGQGPVIVTATDDSGGAVSSSAPIVGIPTISPSSFVYGQATDVTVTCYAADADGTITRVAADLSGIGGSATQPLTLVTSGQSVYYTWSGNLTPMSSGAKTITVTVTDNDAITQTVTVPANVGPVVAGTARIYKGQRYAQLMLTCTATNEDQAAFVGTVTADLSLLGGSSVQPLTQGPKGQANQWTWTGFVALPGPDVTSVKLTATDKRGGINTAAPDLQEILAPVISKIFLTQPLSRNQLTDVQVSCDVTDAYEAITSVTVDLTAIGGAPTQTLTRGQGNSATWSWTGKLAPPGQGATQITFSATTASGILTTANLKLQFANSSLLIFNSAVTGTLVSSQPTTVTVSCTPVSSDSVVTSVTADLSALGAAGPATLLSQGNGTWSCNVDVVPPGTGVVAVTITAKDANSKTATDTVYVNVAAPVVWAYDSQLLAESSPTVLADGTVYMGLYGSTFNGLVAIDPSGSLKWQCPTGGRMQSSPAVASDGAIYVGCDDMKLYAVMPDGKPKWASPYLTGGEIHSSPAIGPDGIIYFGSDDGNVYAIDPDSQKLMWSAAFATGSKVRSSPVVSADGQVLYVGSWDKNVYAINTADGSPVWSHLGVGMVDSSPAIVGNTIYVSDLSGYLYSLDRLTGNENWKLQLDGNMYSSPSVGVDGTVYVGAGDGNLYALYPTGLLKWAFDTGGAVRSSPAIAKDGTVYVGSNSNALFAINADGTLKWQLATGDVVRSSPAVGADGTVYVASFDGKVYAVKGSSSLPFGGWPMFRHDAWHNGTPMGGH